MADNDDDRKASSENCRGIDSAPSEDSQSCSREWIINFDPAGRTIDPAGHTYGSHIDVKSEALDDTDQIEHEKRDATGKGKTGS